MRECIADIANVASIITAVVAVAASVYFKWDSSSKIKKMESYLKIEKAKSGDKGQRSLLHLMANVGLTESEILHASFKSRIIARRLTTSAATHLANDILFEYDPSGSSN
jgi:hypothetical protein